jgi:hypothetical protein
LMSNHVHLIAAPKKANVLGPALKDAHGRYASYWNATHCSSGHVWQGRYYSCPLDESHLWEALRYTELNPVRASMVANAEGWGWSVLLLIADQQQQSHGSGWSCGEGTGLLQAGASTSRLASPRPRWLRYVTTHTPVGRWGRQTF